MKLELEKFATPKYPLRASRLQDFLRCPWRVTLVTFGADDPSGEAADTGSACHKAVATWHKTGGDAAAAVAAMREHLAEYPQADMQTAASLFLAYATDIGNNHVDLVLCEEEVTFTLEAPEGPPITIVGHVDQVRRSTTGKLTVWDLKTSKKMPHEVLWSTCVQGAAYCMGAMEKLGEPVYPGGIIMPRRSPMHIPFTWEFTDLERILQPLVYQVMLIRKGIVTHIPDSENCRWCHTGGPDSCLPQLRYHLPVLGNT